MQICNTYLLRLYSVNKSYYKKIIFFSIKNNHISINKDAYMTTDPCKYTFRLRDAFLGSQMLFVAFGALVLVPILTGLNTNVALFTAGIGTLIFQIITRGQIPIFLASSFAFIVPIQTGIQTWGIPATMGGLMCAGLLYILISLLVRYRGAGLLFKILPPIVTGPVIMVIGLALAPTAVNMALGKSGDGQIILIAENKAIIIAMASLLTTVIVSICAKGWLKLIPILSGIVVGYSLSLFLGLVDFSPITTAAWFGMPPFSAPTFKLEAILFILPVAIAPAIEHFGDILAISSVTGKDFFKKPGIHKTLLADGIATATACAFGGPPNTTYSEVTGAVALTRAFNPAIMTWTAIIAIVLSFVTKLGAFLSTIPTPVMGGIMVLLFGAIMVVGMDTLIRAKVDLLQPRNLVIVAIIIIFGVGGMVFQIAEFRLAGIGLAAITGVVLNLLLPKNL